MLADPDTAARMILRVDAIDPAMADGQMINVAAPLTNRDRMQHPPTALDEALEPSPDGFLPCDADAERPFIHISFQTQRRSAAKMRLRRRPVGGRAIGKSNVTGRDASESVGHLVSATGWLPQSHGCSRSESSPSTTRGTYTLVAATVSLLI